MNFRSLKGLVDIITHQTKQSKLFCASKQSSVLGFLPHPVLHDGRYFSFYQRYVGEKRGRFGPLFLQILNKVRNRYCMWKLRYFLAQNFDEFEFVAGTKQAAKAMIDAVRSLDWSQINKFCTPQSSGDIYALAQEYRKQLYPAIVRFDVDHFRTAMPTSVRTRYISDRWYLCVDMAFLGLRNVRDFDTQSEQQEMLKLTDQVLEKSKLQSHLTPGHQRIVLGELLLTFHRELIGSEANESKLDYGAVAEPEAMSEPTDGWLIDNYKMHKIRLVNYSPVTMQYRIIEFRS